MRAYVFTDASLERHAGQFVWLEINTEKKDNAPVRQQYPVAALPTYLVVDPRDESVLLRWVGGAKVEQLHSMLDEVLASYQGRAPAAPADEALARADALYGEARYAEAVVAYREALDAAPTQWEAYSRTVESLLFAMSSTQRYAEGARLALQAYPRVRHTASAANVAATGLDCALSMTKDDSTRGRLIDSLVEAAEQVAGDTSIPVAADDRSAVFITLVSAREDAGDTAGARQIAERWAAFLEEEAAKAKTPDARAVFDSHRLSAYLELGEPERAIPMLEASERDLPDDYNPPARLAIVYQRMEKWDEALAASDRALAKAYGPRRLTYLRTRAAIFEGMGDKDRARATLADAVREAEALPEGQRSERTIARLREMLTALDE
ncbi:MAG: tetratricopeptide repeat protein [Deltaproteobacteria bacterium]|jgi:tetratricopeptide (TPR) repeat protein|nr:tetratricopeptide repeat protein [Deltaproteobacteria bacterium]